MMKQILSVLMLLTALVMVGCNKPRVIPDDVLSEIFRDAMLINAYYQVKSDASTDSLNIYEPVFARYGYTAEDVQNTVDNISRRKNARLVDVAERMISSLEGRMQYLNHESAKLDTIESVAHRLYTSTLLNDTTVVASTKADSTRLRFEVFNLNPGHYTIECRYEIDSLDKDIGRRYRIYFERNDSTRREVASGSLLRRGEIEFHQNHTLPPTEDDIRCLVIDMYDFDDNVKAKDRTVPKIKILRASVFYTPTVEECLERLLDEQTNTRIFSDSLIHRIENLSQK